MYNYKFYFSYYIEIDLKPCNYKGPVTIFIGICYDLNVLFTFLQNAIPKAQYGGRHTVTMLPGGGIGPELMGYVTEVFRLEII